VWLVGGASGRTSDLRFIGRRFKSYLGAIAQWLHASYLHLCASVTNGMHWPRVTDLVVYKREISTYVRSVILAISQKQSPIFSLNVLRIEHALLFLQLVIV